MEASGFLQLCKYVKVDSLGVVKGISDWGDATKGHVPAAYEAALRNTAVAVREWIIHSIPAVDWERVKGLIA
jgi:nucleoside phosphorylase